jgi:hypothetical protein
MGARRPRANQEAYTLNRSRAVLRRSKLDDGTGPHLLPRPREYKVRTFGPAIAGSDQRCEDPPKRKADSASALSMA